MQFNLNRVKKIHFTGIKGVGMTALALCVQDLGKKVSGSDVTDKFITDEILKKRKIGWQVGFSPKHVSKDTDFLVFTGAHGGEGNIEVVAAEEKGIPIFSHAQALGEFIKGKIGISTCGVGGKTTTASMIATVLYKAALRPSFAIGVSEIFPLGIAGRFEKKGKYFVAEADEYANSPSDKTPRFLYQTPKIIVITNIEHDHPDVYPNIKATIKAFKNFIDRIPRDGLLVACIDNENVSSLLQFIKAPVQTYGFSSKADWQIKDYQLKPGKTTFSLKKSDSVFENLVLKVPGKFNILNATASFIVANFLGLNFGQIKRGLGSFLGTKRRFEKIGEFGGVLLYDDYAHHPCEIKATLQATRDWLAGKRIIAIFQPHTYSRTKYLLKEFGESFTQADKVIITKIYASAREKDDLGVSGQTLVQEIAKNGKEVYYQPDCQTVCRFLKENVRAGDVIFTLGAGDIFLWHKEIKKVLKGE